VDPQSEPVPPPLLLVVAVLFPHEKPPDPEEPVPPALALLVDALFPHEKPPPLAFEF